MRRPKLSRAARAAGLAVLVLLPLAIAQQETAPDWELEEPAPLPDGRLAVLDRLEEVSCGECHSTIVAEWAGTAHALAWVDEIYREEIGDRKRPENCHGCHIPQPLHVAGIDKRPSPRSEGQHFGVSCEACHLDGDGAQLGPRGQPTDAHATRRSLTMVGSGTNQLCAACHRTNIGPVIGVAKDFERSGQAERGRTCVGCHMAVVQRPDGTTTRSHALQTPRDPAFLRRSFAPLLTVEGSKSVVTITNQAGHRVPGLVGRDIIFVAQVVDAAGQPLGQGTLKLNSRSYLPVDESVRLEVDAVGASVVLSGTHHDPRLEDPVVFLQVELSAVGQE